eukprot:jgi/Psemu1/35085/gm1.35085_g
MQDGCLVERIFVTQWLTELALTDAFHGVTEPGTNSSKLLASLKQCLILGATHYDAKQSLSCTNLGINLHHWSPDPSSFDLQVFAASQTFDQHSFCLQESI